MYAPETFDTVKEAREYVTRWTRYGHRFSRIIDYPSVSQTSAPGEEPKGFFTRTTYPDRLENETEYGWKAIAERVSRNIRRLDKAMEPYGFTKCDFPEAREGEPECWHVHKDGVNLNEDEGFSCKAYAREWAMEHAQG